MNEQENSGEIARILYKEIVAGDKRKVLATSNDTKNGGGARDFRFGSYSKLLPVIKKMFPKIVREKRVRGKAKIDVDLFQGTFYWVVEGGQVMNKDSYFEPPTDARKTEGRITRVPEYKCFELARMPKEEPGNRILLLLIQLKDGTVWPHFAGEASLRKPDEWDSSVATELINCLDAKRPKGRTAIGYRDFILDTGYCNGN